MFVRRAKQKWLKRKYGLKVDSHSEEDYLTNLRYADDVLLVARSLPQLRNMLADVEKEAAKVGLKLHPGKTKILHNNIGYGIGAKVARCGSMQIEILDSERHADYLGTAVKLTGIEDEEVASRVSKAWAKYGVFRSELRDRQVPIELRLKLFDTIITPTILYGSETWPTKRISQRKLHATQMKMMRLLIHAHRTYDTYDDHVEWIKDATTTAVDVMLRYGIRKWTETQSAKKWAWAGKICQSHASRWTAVTTAWIPHASRPRGRPKKRWVDDINGFLSHQTGIRHEGDDWRSIASCPKTWESFSAKFVNHVASER